MKLIDKSLRDIVISIMEESDNSSRNLLCQLNGLDINFVVGYFQIALFEKLCLSEDVIIEKISFNFDDYIEIGIYNRTIDDINNYNSGFGLQYNLNEDPHSSFQIPKCLYSEWIYDIFEKFGTLMNFGYNPQANKLKDNFKIFIETHD